MHVGLYWGIINALVVMIVQCSAVQCKHWPRVCVVVEQCGLTDGAACSLVPERVRPATRVTVCFAFSSIVQGPDGPTPLATETTQNYLVQLLQAFCVWNALEDDEMRDVLEKNAIVKLIELDALFEPVQHRMGLIADGVRELTGEAPLIEGESEHAEVIQATPVVDSHLDNL